MTHFKPYPAPQKRKQPAQGTPVPKAPGMRHFDIAFTDHVAEELTARAIGRGISTSAIVRELIDKALRDA